jgi:nitrogen fixation protein NifU and related proteins
MDDLYKEIILERYKNPRNLGNITHGIQVEEVNALCGDKIKIWLEVKNNTITDAKFEGSGCAISVAATDILMDMIKGKKITQVQQMSGAEIENEMGIELSSVRKRCAYIGLEAIKKIKNSLINL